MWLDMKLDVDVFFSVSVSNIWCHLKVAYGKDRLNTPHLLTLSGC